MASKIWTDNLSTPKEKEEFLALLKTSLVARRLAEILEGIEAELDRADDKDIESPAWPLQAASRQGQKKMARKIKQLLTER